MAWPANQSIVFSVSESSQVGEARRNAERIASALGFDETRRGELAIVVTELATNLSRHAKGGELVIRPLQEPANPGIEILSIDRGPGIANVGEAVRDGFSTGATSGTGLGAAARLSTEFDAFSTAPGGTVILSRLYARPLAAQAPELPIVGVVCLPKKGEQACGDAWHVEHLNGRTVILIADGLGHGLAAAEAAQHAVRTFQENVHQDGPRLMQLIHDALRSTRGAAAAILELRTGQREIRFTGVGNIASSILTPTGTRSMISHNGTLGAEMRRVQEFTYPWPGDDALLVMHSDGLESRWQMGKHLAMRFRHPGLVAGLLYRDFRRERDDVTCLVLSTRRRGP